MHYKYAFFISGIKGRSKEILITAGGENVAPVAMEDIIKEELPCISNAVLVGDTRKFLSMLLTLKVVINKENDLPTDDLTPHAILWCASIGSNATKVSDILDEPPTGLVKKEIERGISRANARAVSRAATIKKWALLPNELSFAGGELGPTLKLKRFYFNKKYEKAIDALYE